MEFGAGVMCEFLEAAFHLILYIREIYPDGVFRKRSKYNVSVMMCIHPDVEEYLKDVCNSILAVITEERINKVVLCITNEDGRPLEQFVFEISIKEGVAKSASEILDIEACFRAFLLKLNVCDAMLIPLPKGCTFSILVYLKELASDNLELNQDFPWIRVAKNEVGNPKDFTLIPLKSYTTNIFNLQCYVQERDGKAEFLSSSSSSSSSK